MPCRRRSDPRLIARCESAWPRSSTMSSVTGTWSPARTRAARLRVESARHHQRRAREARLELERDRDHRLRGGAAAVEEHEQVLGRVLWGGREAEDPAGGHWKNCYLAGGVL